LLSAIAILDKTAVAPEKNGCLNLVRGVMKRRFVHPTAATIILHKPHPRKYLKMYMIDDILEILKQEEMI